MAKEYVFVDEWDVKAPIDAIFNALADARTYPDWWTPVYIDVAADGPPAIGVVSRQHFKGRLPYHLRIRSEIIGMEKPAHFEVRASGDLSGTGRWTLIPLDADTVRVKFDWHVNADKPLLKLLTPVLRPLFRWNHGYAISCAKDGLERYARGERRRRE